MTSKVDKNGPRLKRDEIRVHLDFNGNPHVEPARPSECPTLEDLELAIVEAVREMMRENGDLPARPSEPAETLEQVRDRLAKEQHIYEPKYGGKDHSGYDTLMKYEVNYEREEAFVAGFDAAIEYVRRGGKV